MRFEERYERRQRRALTLVDAAEILGVTARTCRRWRDRYEADGAEGLQDRRIETMKRGRESFLIERQPLDTAISHALAPLECTVTN